MRTWRTLQAICDYAHALRFAVGLHGTKKFHPILKYKHYMTIEFLEYPNAFWKYVGSKINLTSNSIAGLHISLKDSIVLYYEALY